MTHARKQFLREVAVTVVAAAVVGVGTTQLTLYTNSATQAQTNQSLQGTSDDHETRIRVIESAVIRIDENVKWLVEFNKSKWSKGQ